MLNVLVAEDNFINQRVLCAYLNQENISVSVAQNGRDAFELYSQKEFDLVLMDISMPVMDGFESLKLIREYEKYNEVYTPVIAVTASDPHHDKEKYIKAGFDNYLPKPIDLDLLYDMIVEYSDIKFAEKG